MHEPREDDELEDGDPGQEQMEQFEELDQDGAIAPRAPAEAGRRPAVNPPVGPEEGDVSTPF